MKAMIAWLVVLPLAGAMAEEKKVAPKARPVAKHEPAPQSPIPAGAKEIAPETWRYTDPKGKVWIYRRTPFGFMKSPEEPPAEVKTDAAEEITAVEQGDSVRLTRRTPFGKLEWVRKKMELEPAERAAWDRARGQQAAKAAEK